MPARKLAKLYLPALSVLVSCLAPWSLTLRMTTSAQGFPFTSRIVPPIEPVWAAARGASTFVSVPIRMAASAQDLRKLFMLHSPFHGGAPPGVSGFRCAPLSLSRGPIPSSVPGSNGSAVRDGIWRSGFGKGAQPQQAAIACAAGSIFVLVARPSEMQGCAQSDEFLEHPVIFQPAVRVAGAIFRYRSDVDRSCADRFRPAHCYGKKMRVAKGNIRYGNRAAVRTGRAQFIF